MIEQKISAMFWKVPESRTLEFKESLPAGESIAKTIVAFANGAGGKLVVGVKDTPRKIIGVPDDMIFEIEEKISSYIFDLCAPIIIPEIYIQAVDNKQLLVVEIFPGSQKPYFLKKRGKQSGSYIRVGSSNRKASIEILDELERQKRKISFDSVVIYEDFDFDMDLRKFVGFLKEKTGLDISREHFKNLGLLVCERDREYPVNGAVLLSESPLRQRLFPYAKIECARFKGVNTRVFLDQASIEVPLFAAPDLCIDFIKRNIALSSVVDDVYRKDRWEYPLAAVREAVINAIIHRDYSILGSDIKIALFDDMLEITSPGPLPDTMPIERLGSGRSEIRNRVLAPIFKKLKLIESWGTGVQRMRHEVNKHSNIDLEFRETEYSFQVQFIRKDYQKSWQSLDGADAESGQGRVRAESGQSQGRAGAESGQSRGRVGAESGQSQESARAIVLGEKILQVLMSKGPLSKSEIAALLDFKKITGHLNREMKSLLDSGMIQYTIPEKPQSRLQKYKIGDMADPPITTKNG